MSCHKIIDGRCIAEKMNEMAKNWKEPPPAMKRIANESRMLRIERSRFRTSSISVSQEREGCDCSSTQQPVPVQSRNSLEIVSTHAGGRQDGLAEKLKRFRESIK
jgi:hypothetical protein